MREAQSLRRKVNPRTTRSAGAPERGVLRCSPHPGVQTEATVNAEDPTPQLRRLERLRRASQNTGDAEASTELGLELAAAYRRTGRLTDALAVLDEVDRAMDEQVATDHNDWETRAAHGRMLIALHQGRFSLADGLANESSGHGARGVVMFLAWTKGNFQDVDAMATAAGDDPLASTARCLVAVERGDLETARAALAVAELTGHGTEWEGLVRYAAATTALLSGDAASAMNELDRAERLVLGWQGTPVIPTLCAGMRATMLLHMGHVEGAIEILNDLVPTENHSNCPGRFRAALALLRRDTAEASRALQDCISLGAAHSERTMVDVLALAAAIAYEDGDDRTADLTFDRAIRMAVANEMQATFYLLQFPVLDAMLARALERPQSTAIQDYIGRVRQSATSRPFTFIEPLSEREREIAILAADGSTVSAIATGLWISANTAKAHLRRIYLKLDVSSREQLRRRLGALGLRGSDAPTDHQGRRKGR